MKYRGGGGGIPQGEFSAGKIPYFNLMRDFPHAKLCLCKPQQGTSLQGRSASSLALRCDVRRHSLSAKISRILNGRRSMVPE